MIVTTVTDLADLKSIWKGLDRAVIENPFRSIEWIGPWCESYLHRRFQLMSLVALEKDHVVGLAPFGLETSIPSGKVMKLLGTGEVCTDYASILVDPAVQRSQVGNEFAEYLSQQFTEWDKIEFDCVHDSDMGVRQFADAMQQFGHVVSYRKGPGTWRLPLPDTWDELLQRMSKSHRKKIRRIEKRLLQSDKLRVICGSDERSFHQGMQVLEELHQRRWIGQGEPGCFSSQNFKQFLTESGRQFLACDQLRLTWLEFESQPIAADFSLQHETGVFAYQSGISPDHLELEPGRAINIVMARQAIDRGLKFVDFLRGDEPYKASWKAEPMAASRIEIVPRRLGSRVRHEILELGRNIRSFLKSPNDGSS